MAHERLHFMGLKTGEPRPARVDLPTNAAVELRVRDAAGAEQRIAVAQGAAAAVAELLNLLRDGKRVMILAEDQELSPNEIAEILGISRPLVVLRMDNGDLPFRYVGAHRRASLKDVLALKEKLDPQLRAMAELVADGEDLEKTYGL